MKEVYVMMVAWQLVKKLLKISKFQLRIETTTCSNADRMHNPQSYKKSRVLVPFPPNIYPTWMFGAWRND